MQLFCPVPEALNLTSPQVQCPFNLPLGALSLSALHLGKGSEGSKLAVLFRVH